MFNIHLSIEKWKFNEAHKIYVSNQGNVKDINKNKVNFKVSKNGFTVCYLNKEYVPVHNLVLETFVNKDHEGLVVNHINGQKRDNSLKNLEYISEEEKAKKDARRRANVNAAIRDENNDEKKLLSLLKEYNISSSKDFLKFVNEGKKETKFEKKIYNLDPKSLKKFA